MAKVKRKSRSFLLALAFLSVMSGTGGLFGAIGGVVLILLGKSVLGLAAGIILFVPTSVAIGMLAATLLGLALIMRNTPQLAALPRLAATASES